MTKNDKKNLLYFIVRTGMYVNPIDERNIVSFISGYEIGTNQKCKFTLLLSQLLTDKYKIKYFSDGWVGQISRLAEKRSLNWVTVFKKITLEIVSDDRYNGLDETMMKILKAKIESLLERVKPYGNIYFNDDWEEQWLTLCQIKSKWFRLLWNDKEWIIIKDIDKLVSNKYIFNDKTNHIPIPDLIKLIEQYKKLKIHKIKKLPKE